MSQENPLASSSTPVQRSQDSLHLQQRRGLPPIGQEVKIRAHSNLSSQNLRHRSATVGTPPQQPNFYNSNVPQPVVQRQPRSSVVRYELNRPPLLYNPVAVPSFNTHLNLMRMVSVMYTIHNAQELESSPSHPPNPYLQVHDPNGILPMKTGRIFAVSYNQRVQNISTSSNNQVQVSITSSTYFNQSQGFHGQQTFPQSHQVLTSPSTCPKGPQSFNPGSSELSSPQFHQNAMKHPLLAHSISLDNQMSSLNLNEASTSSNMPTLQQKPAPVSITQLPAKKKKASKVDKRKQKEMDDENKYFEPYISEAAVADGLKKNTIVEGVIRINPNQFQHSYVSSEDRIEQDIHIDGVKNRNRALEGDVVAVEILPEPVIDVNPSESKQKQGKVVRILEKVHARKCIGTLKLMPDRNRQRALFIPRDNRIPRLNIPFTNWPNNFYENAKQYENTLFLANITDWYDVRFAVGEISNFLGQAGDMMTETLAILAQNDLDISPYGHEVRHLFPRLDFEIPDDEIKLREDCRKLCIFSIDPFTCRDIDDAVSCKLLENGNYEIGVHISDVSYFLKEDTELDAKVANKATTVYTVEKAFHMLPDELCMLCSLFPGVDKLAFSVFWEITEDAQVLNNRFAKTVIHSCAQLAYEHAQAVLDNKENAKSEFPEIHNGFKYEDIHNTIKILGKISRIFREKRFAGGALRIDQPKVSFNLSPENGMPESYWIHESKESHQLIEEFMLLTNITVAHKIYEDHPNMAFLRAHPPPSQFMLRQLQKSLEPIGVQLDIESAGSMHRSLLPYTGPNCPDKGKAIVLNMLCAKPMTRAKYFCTSGCGEEDFLHYALNVPMYTHFTSPIRRYADIMVHRLLSASLKYREVPNWAVSKIKAIAAQCNKQKYNAKKAGEMSTELYILKYISMHAPLITEAVVVEVRDKYIDVIIIKMGLNRRLFFNDDFPGSFKCLKNDTNSRQSQMEVIWAAKEGMPEVKQIIDMFAIINVEMHKGEDINKVDTKLARPIIVHPNI